MPVHEAHYEHWRGEHEGVWARRWVITRNGLTACLKTKSLRVMLMGSWFSALMVAGFLFFIGQLLVPDSMVSSWVKQWNANIQGFFDLLTSWLRTHPEISVGTTQNVLFCWYAIYLLPFSVFALGMALPALVTRDLASNAIVVYSSKAISRGDYLIGKFGTAFGLLTLTWLGPICTAWFLANLLAPDWTFFWHAKMPLIHLLTFGLPAMLILSALALGVSAFSSREKATPAIWFIWWAVGWRIQDIAVHTGRALQHISFFFDLKQIAYGIFRLDENLKTAQAEIPFVGDMLKKITPETRADLAHPRVAGALLALALMVVGAGLVLKKRVKPE